jgi:thiol-disulfide isomerase/thioredoxin
MVKILVIIPILLCISISNGQTNTQIFGKILGYDNKPMAKANIMLFDSTQKLTVIIDPTQKLIAQKVEADSQGRFTMSLSERGLIHFRVSGTFHQSREFTIFISNQDTLYPVFTLEPFDYVKDFSWVSVVGDFNNFSTKGAFPIKKKKDGTYSGLIPVQTNTLTYQLSFIENNGLRVQGTDADQWKLLNDGTYGTVVQAQNGKAKIDFHPKKIIYNKSFPKIEIIGDTSANKIAQCIFRIEERRIFGLRTSIYVPTRTDEFLKKMYPKELDLKIIKAQLAVESDSVVKEALWLDYLEWMIRFDKSSSPREWRRKFRNIFEAISPSSVFWGVSPYSLECITRTGDRDFIISYAKKVQESNKNREAYYAAGTLLCIEVDYQRIQDSLTTRSGKQWIERTKRGSPLHNLKRGAKLPKFHFASLRDSTKIYENKSFQGRYLLLDLWATWCGHCVLERPDIEKVYNTFKSKNLEVLSVSFDRRASDVFFFEKEKGKMLWPQAYVGTESDRYSVWDRFEIQGIPLRILVDTKGKILVYDDGLYKEDLIKTVSSFIH